MRVSTPTDEEKKAAIEDMLREVLEVESTADIYNEAELYVNHTELLATQQDGKLTAENVAATYSVAGFIVGFKYALENIEAQPND